MTHKNLILASQSQTRKKILEAAGLDFGMEMPKLDENALKASLLNEGILARDLSDALAQAKAQSISTVLVEPYIIGSDQVLDHKGRILSKPTSLNTARRIIIELAGSTHTLWSSAVIMRGNQCIWRHVEKAKMTMRDLNFRQIDAYLEQIGDAAFWSVGSYQVEERGIQLFEKIEGDFFTILGIPLLPLIIQLRHLGFDSVNLSPSSSTLHTSPLTPSLDID